MMWRNIYGFRSPLRVNDMGVVQRRGFDGIWRDIHLHQKEKRVEVYLTKLDGKCSTRILARLVYEAFKGPIPKGYKVVHKNGLKSDNSIYNLVALPFGTSVARPGNTRPVMKVDRDGNVVAIYASTVEAAKANHISQQAISKRCLNRVKDPYRLDGYNYVYEQPNRGRPTTHVQSF